MGTWCCEELMSMSRPSKDTGERYKFRESWIYSLESESNITLRAGVTLGWRIAVATSRREPYRTEEGNVEYEYRQRSQLRFPRLLRRSSDTEDAQCVARKGCTRCAGMTLITD